MPQEQGFYGLGIAPNILSVLDSLNFKTPTPIQEKSIPQALEGRDLIGIAQTGTGKTLAFGVPVIQGVLRGKRGLIILPTRELALQVNETFHKVGFPLGVRTTVIIGGASMQRQIFELQRNPHVIIGTPGRIVDHLMQRNISFKNISLLVLDEADRMLDMGFAPQLNKILSEVPKERQTLLFSATMPPHIVDMAKRHMKLPTSVEIAPQGTAAEKVTQEVFFVQKHDKLRLLEKILSEYRGSVLVFSRTKFGAKKIARGVKSMNHTVAEIHSNKSLNQRREALDGFKNGRYRVLVATDIAARGIDVKGIELVLNYDLPDNAEDYVHRIGRTGRAGSVGHAISFATPDQRGDVRAIERLIRSTLPLSALPELPPHRELPATFPNSLEGRRPFHGPQSGRGFNQRRHTSQNQTGRSNRRQDFFGHPNSSPASRHFQPRRHWPRRDGGQAHTQQPR